MVPAWVLTPLSKPQPSNSSVLPDTEKLLVPLGRKKPLTVPNLY